VKYSHSQLDGKKSSCSPAIVVVVIGVSLVGVWMFTSSTVIPAQNPNIPVLDSKTESTTKEMLKMKSSDSDRNDDNEECASNNRDANTKVLETRTEYESSSSETEKSKSKSKSKSENENSSSDTNETNKPDSEVKNIEEKIWYNSVRRTKVADVKGHQNWEALMFRCGSVTWQTTEKAKEGSKGTVDGAKEKARKG
ncbi:hypothetical protein Tco_1372824, partial [Tanacetum coccineum]